MSSSADKFDASRATEYGLQSRIALAGYDACHELSACLLAAALGRDSRQHVLVAGAGGTAQEVLVTGRLAPAWSYTAVDPSPPMLGLARDAVEKAGLGSQVTWQAGLVTDLPSDPVFDAATLIGVLHHLPGRDAKIGLLQAIAALLKPNAPFVLACNRGGYAFNPLFLKAWGNRWRMAGASDDEVTSKLGKILQGADPPASEGEIGELFSAGGFAAPELFFSSLFWGAWIARRSIYAGSR